MTYALFACSVWLCSPEPLRDRLSLNQCKALAVTMTVEGVQLKCVRRKA